MISSGLPRRIALGVAALASLFFFGCPFSPEVVDPAGGGAGSKGAPCAVDDDCGLPANPCLHTICSAGACTDVIRGQGPAATVPQQPRDCHRVECDGKGGTVDIVDDGDLPDDNNPCTEDTCHHGVEVFKPIGAYVNVTGCDFDHACDGKGQCQKIDFISCSAGKDCISGACYSVLANGEGVCRRASGATCAAAEECASNICDKTGHCADCDAQKNCTGGSCVMGRCFEACAPACSAGYTCNGLQLCVNDCANSPCGAGKLCVNAVCVPKGN